MTDPMWLDANFAATFDSVVRTVNGSTTPAAFSFLAATGITMTASAKLDGSYRMTVSVTVEPTTLEIDFSRP